jgi:hypothetical protein
MPEIVGWLIVPESKLPITQRRISWLAWAVTLAFV